MEKNIEKDFETYVQSMFATPYGKEYFTRLAIMSHFFTNSLVATAELKKHCDQPLIYLEAQRDLARKSLNCLTPDQYRDLLANVLKVSFPEKK